MLIQVSLLLKRKYSNIHTCVMCLYNILIITGTTPISYGTGNSGAASTQHSSVSSSLYGNNNGYYGSYGNSGNYGSGSGRYPSTSTGSQYGNGYNNNYQGASSSSNAGKYAGASGGYSTGNYGGSSLSSSSSAQKNSYGSSGSGSQSSGSSNYGYSGNSGLSSSSSGNYGNFPQTYCYSTKMLYKIYIKFYQAVDQAGVKLNKMPTRMSRSHHLHHWYLLKMFSPLITHTGRGTARPLSLLTRW